MIHLQKIKIKPLTHKMKNRVRNHGEWWIVRGREDFLLLLEPCNANKDQPYQCWVKEDRDFERV